MSIASHPERRSVIDQVDRRKFLRTGVATIATATGVTIAVDGVRRTISKSTDTPDRTKVLFRSFPNELNGAVSVDDIRRKGADGLPVSPTLPWLPDSRKHVEGSKQLLQALLTSHARAEWMLDSKLEQEYFSETHNAYDHVIDNNHSMLYDLERKAPECMPDAIYCEGLVAGDQGANFARLLIKSKKKLDSEVQVLSARVRHASSDSERIDLENAIEMRRWNLIQAHFQRTFGPIADFVLQNDLPVRGVEDVAFNRGPMREMMMKVDEFHDDPAFQEERRRLTEQRSEIIIDTIAQEQARKPLLLMGAFNGPALWNALQSKHVSYVFTEPRGNGKVDEEAAKESLEVFNKLLENELSSMRNDGMNRGIYHAAESPLLLPYRGDQKCLMVNVTGSPECFEDCFVHEKRNGAMVGRAQS